MQPEAVGDMSDFEVVLESSDRPCWLIDVDGVLNARRPGWSSKIEHRNVTSYRAGVLQLTWSAELIDHIRAFAVSGAVDLIWATTWCPEAEILEDLWHLPPLTRAWTADLRGPAAADAKFAAAMEVALASRPLIWTDDELAGDLSGPDRLEIRPDSRCGLTSADVGAIEDFIVRNTASN